MISPGKTKKRKKYQYIKIRYYRNKMAYEVFMDWWWRQQHNSTNYLKSNKGVASANSLFLSQL